MKNPKSVTMKNGRPATKGICPTCGTKMYRIGKVNSAKAKAKTPRSQKKIAAIRKSRY